MRAEGSNLNLGFIFWNLLDRVRSIAIENYFS